MKRVLSVVLAAGLSLGLSACSPNDDLADQFRSGDNKNYIAGDGSVTEFRNIETRKTGAAWTSTTAEGEPFSSDDLLGNVSVLNFWYAGCAPCRAEAPELDQLGKEFADQGLIMLGVDLRDSAETALAFNRNFGISYPSVIDAESGDVVLAYTGIVTPDAVPTTLVLDREGRVAARVIGRIDIKILRTLIRTTLEEK